MFILDEVGKMELLSRSFIRCVRQSLDEPSCSILGTIPLPKGTPPGLVAEVWSRTDVKVFMVSTNTSPLWGRGGGIFGSVYIWSCSRSADRERDVTLMQTGFSVHYPSSVAGLILKHACVIDNKGRDHVSERIITEESATDIITPNAKRRCGGYRSKVTER